MASREVYPKDVVKALRKLGFYVANIKGSHFRLVHADGRRVTVAMHPKPLFKGASASDFGRVMGAAMKAVSGRASGDRVSAIVKRLLEVGR